MSDEIGWQFPALNDGTREGFNVPAIDMFKSERLQALVREVIQNSLDARQDKTRPVEVRFTLGKVTDLESTGFAQLGQYFAAAQALEDTRAGKDFYKCALDQIDDGAVTFLGVHDYNTMGLVGPTYDPPSNPQTGPWLALVKGSGMTYKDSAAALGSFGHGSRAPFAMSELRTLFYLSHIETAEAAETRFQGKSILQSVPLNAITGEDQWCVATGYFGIREHCLPLVDSDIPRWATEARPEPEVGKRSVGTSIFVPEPFGVENAEHLWAQVKLAVVANFYYAVFTHNLVVRLGNDELIDKDTIEAAYDAIATTDLLETLAPTDKVRDRLQSALTVRHAEASGTREIPGIGSVDWYLRMEEVTGRNVGVARGNGMLITRAAERLQRFFAVRPFDLFVCVSGEMGSQLLRRLENPEHTEFAFDRISDPVERKVAEATYANFTKDIRALVEEHASLPVEEEQVVDDLDDFFRGNAGLGSDANEGELARSLRVTSKRLRTHRDSRPTQLTGEGGESHGHGLAGGGGAPSTKGGDILGQGKGTAKSGLRTGMPVRDLRVVRDGASSGVAVVTFTPVDSSRKRLVLLRSGDSETERLRFRTEKDVATGAAARDCIELGELRPVARKRLRLVFEPGDLEYAIEGRLEP